MSGESGGGRRRVAIASYADDPVKLALILGRWYKHYQDAVEYLQELYKGPHIYFDLPVPTDDQVQLGRSRGKVVDKVTVKRGLFGNKYKVYYQDSGYHEKLGHHLKEGSKKAGGGAKKGIKHLFGR